MELALLCLRGVSEAPFQTRDLDGAGAAGLSGITKGTENTGVCSECSEGGSVGQAGGQSDCLSHSQAVGVHCCCKKNRSRYIYTHIESVVGVSSQCGGTAEWVWWGI